MKSQQPTLKIQIPEPCSQRWDEMIPETGGRHCISCAKTVVDFTRMTDAQIWEVMRNSAGGCGRFREDQLNRELIAPPARKYFSLGNFYKLAASLLLVFSASKVVAQEKKGVQIKETIVDKPQQLYNYNISGFVIDSEGEPLTGATIKLNGQAAVAGIDGEFEMRIPDSAFVAGIVSLTFSFNGYRGDTVGYRSDRVNFSTGDFPVDLKVKMQRPSESKTPGGNFEIIPPSKITKQLLTDREIQKMAVRDVASQVATTSIVGCGLWGNQPITRRGCGGDNTIYIIDGVLQTGTPATVPKPKKWWQFWKRH